MPIFKNRDSNRESLSGTKRTQRSAKSQMISNDPKRKSLDSVDWDSLESEDGSEICGYIKKVYNMMSDTKHSHIVSWNESGDMIVIRDKKKLEQILSEYFESKNFTSFKRQLHYYGFCKSTDSDGNITFSNSNFQRDYPKLLYNIKRNTTGGNTLGKGKQFKTEVPPNTYSMNSHPATMHGNGITEVELLRQRVQLLEQENSLFHQQLCAITERLNRMELVSNGMMDYPRHPIPPSEMNPRRPDVSANTSASINASTPIPTTSGNPQVSPLGGDEVAARTTTATTPTPTTNPPMPPLEPQMSSMSYKSQLSAMSLYSMSNINVDNVDENILDREDSFFTQTGDVDAPPIKRYSEYTTDELKQFTDSFRKMIQLMEMQRYSSRAMFENGVGGACGGDETNSNSTPFSPSMMLNKDAFFPLRGQVGAMENSDDEEEKMADPVLNDFRQSLSGSVSTIPASNVMRGKCVGAGAGSDESDGTDEGNNLSSRRDMMEGFQRQCSLDASQVNAA